MVVYSLPTCPKCSILKAKLDAAGFDYTVCEDEKLMAELGVFDVPMLETETAWYDFNDALRFCRERAQVGIL